MFKKNLGKLAFLAGVLVVGSNSAMAAAADPATIVTASTTIFEAVTTLTVAAVGFGIAVRLVKGIKK